MHRITFISTANFLGINPFIIIFNLLIPQVWYLKAGKSMCFTSVLCFWNVLFKENPLLDFYDLFLLAILMSNSCCFLTFFEQFFHQEDSEARKNFQSGVSCLVCIHYSEGICGFPRFAFSLGVLELALGMTLDSEASGCKLSPSRIMSSGLGGGGQKSSLGQICWKSVSAWPGNRRTQ